MASRNYDKFKARSGRSYNRDTGFLETKDGEKRRKIVLNFSEHDVNQGQDFEEWENENILALAINKLKGVCGLTRLEAVSQRIIKEYKKGVFPPSSDFTHPKHVPDDICWCSMHIQGKECIIGYFDDHVFNVVFLDKDHKFWKTEKKHT